MPCILAQTLMGRKSFWPCVLTLTESVVLQASPRTYDAERKESVDWMVVRGSPLPVEPRSRGEVELSKPGRRQAPHFERRTVGKSVS